MPYKFNPLSGQFDMVNKNYFKKGTNVVSANNATLVLDGYVFDVTGAVQMNTLTTTGVPIGFEITLQFVSNPVIKHNTAGTGASFFLAGAGDFQTSVGATLIIYFDGTYWKEKSRTTF